MVAALVIGVMAFVLRTVHRSDVVYTEVQECIRDDDVRGDAKGLRVLRRRASPP